MTTFARAGFDVAGYLACRPTYPKKVYDTILDYHAKTGRYERALDLGCGPGFVALNLAERFKQVIGLDPASKMVETALQPQDPSKKVTYKVGNAEELVQAGMGEGEEGLDLVVAAQAAHWFDYPKVWRQLSRVVRPGGTVAFIGYAEMVLPNHPHLNHLISHHSRSNEALGQYWQPGRRIVEALLDPVPFPVTPRPPSELQLAGSRFAVDKITEQPLPNPDADEFDFSAWDPSTAVRLKEMDGKQWLMTKKFTLSTMAGYLRTWSALHAYHEAHPEDKAKKGKGFEEGDIADRLVGKLADGLGVKGDEEFEAGWPLVVLMLRKKQ